jgi:hypothetical protein
MKFERGDMVYCRVSPANEVPAGTLGFVVELHDEYSPSAAKVIWCQKTGNVRIYLATLRFLKHANVEL